MIGCRRSAPPDSDERGSPQLALRPGPPWPAAVEPPAPPGHHWETVRHETVHVRLLVPDGSAPRRTRDEHGYPAIDLTVAGEHLRCQFDGGIGALGETLAKRPPMVYRLPVQASQLDGDHAAAHYRDARGGVRISGFAPGVACKYEPYGDPPPEVLDAVYTVCASVRSPAPGPWRPASVAERAHGGMTDVPEGGWVESQRPSTPGAAVLRPGRFVAQLHLGALTIRSTVCPASFDDLRKVETPEVEVELEQRQRATGDAWVRRSTERYADSTYPGATLIFVPRGARCCLATIVPWTAPPDPSQVDYAIALCDTFRET